MANRQTTPGMNVPQRTTGVSGQVRAANFQNAYQMPDVSGLIKDAASVAKKYYEGEKEAAFKRFDLLASQKQMDELEKIRVAESNEVVPEIEKGFQSSLAEEFSQDNWGKQWLKERGDLFFAANKRDVFRAGLAKQKELYTLQMDKTLNTFADDISSSAADKAKVLIGDAEKLIDGSQLFSPEEKKKSKDNFIGIALKKMASNRPQQAIDLLKDDDFTKGLNIDAKEMIHSIAQKQFAEIDFQRRVAEFNNERELSKKLDDITTEEALRTLEENEGNVSSKYFKAKQRALLSAKGITAETRADTFADILNDISLLDKSDINKYYSGANNILEKIEDRYASGELSLTDKKAAMRQIYRGQGANIETLKEETGDWYNFWDFTFKDANEFIGDNYSGVNGNKILLDYFRAVSDQDYSNDEKKKILKGLIDKENGALLSYPSFKDALSAEEAYNSGSIKDGDYIYVGGQLKKVG